MMMVGPSLVPNVSLTCNLKISVKDFTVCLKYAFTDDTDYLV